MSEGLVELRYYKSLKDSSFHGMGGDIMWLPYPEKVAEKACIKEIKLRTLDDPLRKILMVRRKEVNDEPCLKY